MDFSYNTLRKFYERMRCIAKIIPLGEWDTGKRSIILRHDIDLDIDLAYRMAKIEHDIGIRSSYMVMMTCPTYNPASIGNRALLHKMVEMGHEIGLHFDASLYSYGSGPWGAREEARTLCFITEQKVRSISLHDPGSDFFQFPGFVNAYNPEISSDDCYLSDSRMSFRDKDPFEFIKRAKDKTIQVLLHPEHWSVKDEGYPVIFNNIGSRYLDELDDWFRVNSTYCEQMGDSRLVCNVI